MSWPGALGRGPSSVDAVLLLGPMYHLWSRHDRLRVLRESARVTRPGGPVSVAAISRCAGRLDGGLQERLDLRHPHLLPERGQGAGDEHDRDQEQQRGEQPE